MSIETDDFREDEEQDDYAARSIFAAGWFRAVLVLTVLAIVVVVALPYLLNWFEPAPSPPKMAARPNQPAESYAPPAAPSPAPVQSASATPPAATRQALPSAPPQKAHSDLLPMPGSPRAASAAPVKPMLPPQIAKVSDASTRPERLPGAPAKAIEASSATAGGYWVQVGVFKDPDNADTVAKKLRTQGFPVQVTRVTRNEANAAGLSAGTYHVVRAGGFPQRVAAISARDSLSDKGYAGFVTQGPAR
jgi:cell division septation protein DedD